MRVAVMQPYFYPYMGYFQLVAAVDLFVIFDCVQFPRRGRVHRCDVPDGEGGVRWLTLPLARQGRDTAIRDLAFAEGARAVFDRRLAELTWLRRADLPAPVAAALGGEMLCPAAYVEANLRAVASLLAPETRIVRSSDLAIPAELRRAHRVRAIARACGATRYLNAPGGRALYDPGFFAEAGLQLEFLSPYAGNHIHMLQALAACPIGDLAADAARGKVEPA